MRRSLRRSAMDCRLITKINKKHIEEKALKDLKKRTHMVSPVTLIHLGTKESTSKEGSEETIER